MADLTKDETREALWANTYEGFVAGLSDPELVALAIGGEVRRVRGRFNLAGNWCPGGPERAVIVLPPQAVETADGD